MKIFQYWDTGSPPDQVAEWIEGFRATNPEMRHRLYDRDRASWFVGKHLGERRRRAFDVLAVPSMQSDYFRASAMLVKGGFHIDADSVTSRPLRELFAWAPQAMILSWNGKFQLGLMMFRQPGDALIAAWLEQITRNIEARLEGNASEVTGPLAMQQVIQEANVRQDAVAAAAARIVHLPWSEAGAWIGPPMPAAYKKSARHWMNWQGSAYLEAAEPAQAQDPVSKKARRSLAGPR